MRICQSFTVARPAPAVWQFFQNIPAVAECLPGAELIATEADGSHRGKVLVALGPFKASFEGEAKITVDPERRSGHIEGRGVDKRGGSHSKIALDYQLHEHAAATHIDLDIDLTLSGPIAQFGRTGIITETAKVLIADFAHNLEARISADAKAQEFPPEPRRLNLFVVFFSALRNAWLKLFGRRQQDQP